MYCSHKSLPLEVLGCGVELYADDTVICFASNTASEIQTQLTADVINVIGWLHANFLKYLTVDKTKVMLVGTHQKLV